MSADNYSAIEETLLREMTDGGVQRRHAGTPPAVPDHTLLRCIGGGSYGEVWLARNVVGTYRAVKVVYRERFGSARPYEREFHGMQSYEPVSRRHEGLVDILQIGRSDSAGFFYYVMELADDAEGGPPLAAISEDVRRAMVEAGKRHRSTRADASLTGETAVAAAESVSEAMPGIVPETYRPRTLRSEIRKNGRLASADCVQLFLTLTAALSSLHRRGLIHRDIKPSNIVIVGGVPKLADIGLVSAAGAEMSFVGTEGFIPPEGPGTEQADVFSLGKVLYEALSGMDRMEFPQLPPVEKGRLDELQPLMELNAVVTRACAGKAEDRYANAAEMLGDLALLQAGRSVKGMRALEGKLRAARRWGLAAAALGAVIAGALGVRAWFAGERAEIEAGARRQVEAAHYSQGLALARAECLSPEMGHRFRALDAVRDAAAKPGGDAVELRSQAITALALPDMRVVQRWPAQRTPDGNFAYARANANATVGAFLAPGGGVRVLRLPDGMEVDRFEPEQGLRRLLPPSPDGRWLPLVPATGSRRIQLRDLQQHRTLDLPEDAGAVDCLWLEDSSGFLIRSERAILLVNAATQQITPVAPFPRESLRSMELISRRGTVAATSGDMTQVHLLEVSGGKTLQTLKLTGAEAAATAVLSPDGGRLVTTASDWALRVWLTDEPEQKPVHLTGHTQLAPLLRFHPGGQLLVSSGWDETTRLFHAGTGRQTGVSREHYVPFGFTADGTAMAALEDSTQDLVVMEFADGGVCQVIGEPPGAHYDISPYQAHFIAGGRVLVTMTGDGMRCYDPLTGLSLGRVPGPYLTLGAWAEKAGLLFYGSAHTPGILFRRAVEEQGVLRLGGPEVFQETAGPEPSVNEDATIRIAGGYNGITSCVEGQPPRLLEKCTGYRTMVASPDARYFAARSVLNMLSVWSTGSGKLLWEMPAGSTRMPGFSTDSQQVMVCGDGSLRGYAVQDGTLLWSTPVPGAHSGYVSASPDGRLLAVRTTGITLHLFDARTHAMLCRLEHPDGAGPQHISWSPDSALLATCRGQHAVNVWNLRRLRAELRNMGLDWDHAPLPEPAALPRIVRVEGARQ